MLLVRFIYVLFVLMVSCRIDLCSLRKVYFGATTPIF
jgi:hypothetical protein